MVRWTVALNRPERSFATKREIEFVKKSAGAEKRNREKGVQLRDFLILEKFGIVVMSGYAVCLCFGAGAWQLSAVSSCTSVYFFTSARN